MTKQQLGRFGEKEIMKMLRDAGLFARYAHIVGSDILIGKKSQNKIKLEIKYARKSGNHWQFCAYRHNHTNCQNSDYVLFVGLNAHGDMVESVHFMPASEITAKTVKIYNPSNGKYAPYHTTTSKAISTIRAML